MTSADYSSIFQRKINLCDADDDFGKKMNVRRRWKRFEWNIRYWQKDAILICKYIPAAVERKEKMMKKAEREKKEKEY